MPSVRGDWGGNLRTHAAAIAAAWGASPENNGPLVAYGLLGWGRRTAFTRNRKLVELKPVEALLCEGSGLQANLYQLMRKAKVPIHAFRKSDQTIEPARPASRRPFALAA